MKRTMLILVSAVGVGACTFPQTTKMEPVGEAQMQPAKQQQQQGTKGDTRQASEPKSTS